VLLWQAMHNHTVRVIDAIVASLWPSNGLQLHAVEVKVSRADLQRELLDPGKSETFAPFCHKFWLCAPRDIVDPAELPAGWGWLAPYGEGAETVLRAEREATAREAEPMTAPRLMGLLRVASRDGKLIRAERLVEELTAHVEPLRAAVESWRALEEKSKMIKTE